MLISLEQTTLTASTDHPKFVTETSLPPGGCEEDIFRDEVFCLLLIILLLIQVVFIGCLQ